MITHVAGWLQRAGPSGPIFGARLGGLAAAVVTALVMSSALSPQQRGTVASFAILQMIGSVAAGLGTGVAAYVLVGQEPERSGAITGGLLAWAGAVFAITLGVVLLLGAPGTLTLWLGPAATSPVDLTLLAVGAAAQYLALSYTQVGAGMSRTMYVAAGFAITPVIAMVGTVIAAKLGSTPEGYMVVQSVSWLLAAAVLIAGFGRFPRVRKADLRLLVRRGAAAAPGDVANALSYRLDTLILGVITGQAAVGIYSLAVQVLEPLWIVATAATNGLLIVFPTIDFALWPARTRRAAIFAVGLTAGGVVAALLLLPTVLRVIGPAYAPTLLVAAALGPGIVALAGSKVLAGYQVASGRLWLSSGIATGSLFVTTAADLALIPSLGAIGASLASSCGYGISVLLWILCFKRYRSRGHFSVARGSAGIEL